LSTVTAEKAVNVSLSFSKFFLPKNAVLKIYSKNEITDGITDAVNGIRKTWNTRVYQGNRINISLKIPVAEKGKILLEIGKVCFGFRKIEGNTPGSVSQDNSFAPQPPPGQSADCNVNIYCPLGNNWQAESRSVAMIYSPDGFLFSGSLVMNTCGTNKPYLLTAWHTFDPQQNPGAYPNPLGCKYVFKYWRLNCSNTVEQYNETYEIDGSTGIGASMVAHDVASDFALILLPVAPSVTSGVTYSGWNRSAGAPSQITALHHPLGDVMKISQSNSNIFSTSWDVQYPNSHWQAKFDNDKGIIQKGSSGGPIYDQDRKLIGQIHGIAPGHPCINSPQPPPNGGQHCACNNGSAEQSAAKTSLSGKFSVSWTGGGSSSSRLKDHLDPLNLNTFTTQTTEIYNLQPDPYTAQVQGAPSICSLNTSEVYSIDLPPGAFISSWGQSNSSVSVNPISPNSASVTYINTQNTSVTITANVVLTGPCNQGTYPRPKTIALGGASCSTRTAYQLVNGNPMQVGNCIRLTQLRSIYPKGKESKPGLTEYYTTVWVAETYPNATIAWSYVSSSGSSGYPSYIVKGDSVEVIISNTLPYGWIRLRCTSTTSCGTYAEDYWFTPQPSPLSCPIFNPCLVAQRTQEITNTSSAKISLSPNPTNGQFKVLLSGDAKDATIREVRVKNKMGVEVFRQVFKNGSKEQTINLFNQPLDIYIVEVFDGKKWLTEKLSLQH
jgi:lysyl endopeptidase